MHRCNCSTRAIETFVKDLGGIAIRQQRAQRFFQHYRSLSTRRPLRQLQTTIGANTDDAFIPFDFEAARRKREGVRRAEKINDDYQEDEEALESGRDDGSNHGEEEWHAEVEIKSPDAPATGTHDRRMDEVRFQALLAEEGQTDASSTPAVPILNLPAISQHIRPKTAPKEDGSTDADASLEKISPRIMRKFRRIEEGKYNRLQTTSSKATGSDVDGSVEEVLEIIEGMQGPSLAKNEKKMKQEASSEDSDGARTGKAKGELKAAAKTSKAKDKSETTIATTTRPIKAPKKERWQIDKAALKQKFGDEGWKPRKRLSPDTLEGIRALHSSDPATYSTQTLAANFQVTPEAIRRILKSKWQPSAEDSAKRMERWEKRGLKKWAEMAEQGMRPPKKWRAMGVGKDGEEGDERKTGNGRKGKEVNSWDDAVEAAGRLPMEGSFADRIL